jgi:hypothetical protein
MFQNFYRLFFIPLSIIYFCAFQSCEEIEGCTNPAAINYNPEANKLKDSCCIRILSRKVTHEKSKIKIYIDNNRFSKVNYKFIYQSPTTDTIKSYPVSNSRTGLREILLQTTISDTLEIDANLKESNIKPIDHKIFSGKKIKVLETIDGSSREYFININNTKNTHLINPKSRNRYKTEQVTYSVIPGFNTTPNRVNKYRGFYNEIDESISYWFENHPESIMVNENEYSMKKFYRTNIIRY